MAKPRVKKRSYRLINFKVFEDDDRDILEWWEGIEVGERSDAIRDVIRAVLGYQPLRRRPEEELAALRGEVARLRDLLHDLPRAIGQEVGSAAAKTIINAGEAPAANKSDNDQGGGLSDQDVQRRAQRMKKARW